MRYIVRKEGMSWTVRDDCDHYCGARRTHGDAMAWADTLATYARRIRFQRDIQRIHASLQRIKENR